MAKDYRYCPQCGYKKLLKRRNWRTRYSYWTCEHGVNNSWSKNEKVRDTPPCGCRIEVEGRNAEIADYGTVLDGIVRAQEPEIKNWLLENDPTAHKRGLEVLYEGERVDVVRLRDREGVCAWLYFKEAVFSGDYRLPQHGAIRSPSSAAINFRGIPLSRLFYQNWRFRLWEKDTNAMIPFNGNLGKRKKKEIVEWAAALDEELPQLLETAVIEAERWKKEQEDIQKKLGELVTISYYNGNTKLSRVYIHHRQLTEDQLVRIAAIVKEDSGG